MNSNYRKWTQTSDAYQAYVKAAKRCEELFAAPTPKVDRIRFAKKTCPKCSGMGEWSNGYRSGRCGNCKGTAQAYTNDGSYARTRLYRDMVFAFTTNVREVNAGDEVIHDGERRTVAQVNGRQVQTTDGKGFYPEGGSVIRVNREELDRICDRIVNECVGAYYV